MALVDRPIPDPGVRYSVSYLACVGVHEHRSDLRPQPPLTLPPRRIEACRARAGDLRYLGSATWGWSAAFFYVSWAIRLLQQFKATNF